MVRIKASVLGISVERDLNITLKMLQLGIIKDIPNLILDWKSINFVGYRLRELLLNLKFEIVDFLLSMIYRFFIGDFAA
jgi:hypothetical protein